MKDQLSPKSSTQYSPQEIAAHLGLLKEKVFQTETKWPHFNLLLNDMVELSKTLPHNSVVVALERTILYGGNSLIAPLFQHQNFMSVECSPASADERGSYNKSMVEDPRFISIPFAHRGEEVETGLDANMADVVVVPNLVHHIADQDKLFAEMARITKPGGSVYVFEPLVRELHQAPDDYLRYTPYGMERIMRKYGLEPAGEHRAEGGPFSVIGYCWTQALQYFPPEKRQEMEEWFYKDHFKQLMEWDEQYSANLVRKHTSFPMSFSIRAIKKAAV